MGKESREMFITWSAAQMLTYNALVQEREYFLCFYQKFGGRLPPIDQKYAHLFNLKDEESFTRTGISERGSASQEGLEQLLYGCHPEA